MSARLVRNADGAIVGVDWRRVEGMTDVKVPGRVPARLVMVGDTILVGDERMVVVTTRANGVPGKVYVGVRTPGGAEVVHELAASEQVRVVAVGAFEPTAERDELAELLCKFDDGPTWNEEDGVCEWHVRLADTVLAAGWSKVSA